MVVNLARDGWGRIVGAALAAFVGSIGVTVLIVTVYGFMLGFQVRGQPDQTRISAFAREVGPAWGPVLLLAFTACAALWVARREREPIRHAVLVGAVAAIAGLVPSWPPDLRDAAFFVAIVGAGWIGGLIGQQTKRLESQ